MGVDWSELSEDWRRDAQNSFMKRAPQKEGCQAVGDSQNMMVVDGSDIGIAGICYLIPPNPLSLELLERGGLIQSEPAVLRQFGFEASYAADAPLHELSGKVVADLLSESGVLPEEVDFFFSTSALFDSMRFRSSSRDPVERYDTECVGLGQRVAAECGLVNAVHVGIGQVGCTSLLAAVRIATAVLKTEPHAMYAVCLTADVVPHDASREVLYNIVSDCVCAVLLKKGSRSNRIAGIWQLSRPEFWNCTQEVKDALTVNYFPVSRRFILDGLARQRLAINDIAMIMPHNVAINSWDILARALGTSIDKVYTGNIRRGHALGADCFMNMRDALAQRYVKDGDRILLFGFGMGGHWAASIVEV
jgi:3-oxoacyl-[acyl-carrier-protein] synthase III